jgi:hypothetical protein
LRGRIACPCADGNAGSVSRAADLVGFSESPVNKATLIGVIGKGFAYIPHGQEKK